MTFQVEPIAFVSATRKTPEDDFWGGEVAEICLVDSLDSSALAGLIFPQRGKNRPNRIGSTICKLVGVAGTVLRVSELDAIDGTPVLMSSYWSDR